VAQADDILLDAGAGQSGGREMAEIVDPKGRNASKLRYTPKPLPEVPGVRPFEITFEPGVGLARKHVFVAAAAWQGPEGDDGHVGQLNSVHRFSSAGRIRKDSRNRDDRLGNAVRRDVLPRTA
jgi:hypothetical protein